MVSAGISFDTPSKATLQQEIANLELSVPAAAPVQEKGLFSKADKEWTIMVFVNGKNNLETYALKDMNEMEMIGSSDKVNVVVQIGRMAEAYEINVAPHNYYSHLADLHSLHLCAVLPNVRIMEIDIDDVPWKAELVTHPPAIKDGHILVSDAPGWGAEINEEVLRAHPWPAGPRSGPQPFYGMSPESMGTRPGS